MYQGYQRKAVINIIMAALVILSIVFSLACQPPASEPSSLPTVAPKPTPTATEPELPLIEWKPDGFIRGREYSKYLSFGLYQLHWRSDDQYCYIAMNARTNGWVAMAIQPGQKMNSADMIFGSVKDGKAYIYDCYSTGDFGPHPPDTELGGTNDIIEFGGRENGTDTVIEFKRPLKTQDKYDNPLSRGVNKIIWAYGTDDDITQIHKTRGYGEIEF